MHNYSKCNRIFTRNFNCLFIWKRIIPIYLLDYFDTAYSFQCHFYLVTKVARVTGPIKSKVIRFCPRFSEWKLSRLYFSIFSFEKSAHTTLASWTSHITLASWTSEMELIHLRFGNRIEFHEFLYLKTHQKKPYMVLWHKIYCICISANNYWEPIKLKLFLTIQKFIRTIKLN